jgi:hypothetical protein
MDRNSLTSLLAKATGLASTEVTNVLEELGPEQLGRIHGAVCVEVMDGASIGQDFDTTGIRSLLCA